MTRYFFLFFSLTLILSCKEEKKKDDFENANYISTFGASQRVPVGNSGFSINLPSTHYIDRIDGNGFVEFHIKSTDTTINKGEGIIRFNLKHGEINELMVMDTNFVSAKYDSTKDTGKGPQIYIWSEKEANQVEEFNLGRVITSFQMDPVDTIFNNGFEMTDTTRTKHVSIGNTGLSIDLPITHKIEKQESHAGDNFSVYYFTPIDTSVYHGEGGIYFGPYPDAHSPRTAYTSKIITGTFLGVKTKWVEYKTAEYTQTETFIENVTGQKIHIWFYANNPIEMAKLLKMVNTITK